MQALTQERMASLAISVFAFQSSHQLRDASREERGDGVPGFDKSRPAILKI
nr:hypothetical protein [Bacteroidota bacterium]